MTSLKRVIVGGPQEDTFCSNRAVTSRYTLLNFLPRIIYELLNPLDKVANFYFLVVGLLQMVPAITITGGAPGTFMPLTFVLAVEALMRAIEDFTRHKSDRLTNEQMCERLSPADGAQRWEKVAWADLQVGDIVCVHNREAFPADLLLLAAQPDAHTAWGALRLLPPSLA